MAKRRRPEPKSNSNTVLIVVAVVLLFGAAIVVGGSIVVYKLVAGSSNGNVNYDSAPNSRSGWNSDFGSSSGSSRTPAAPAASVPTSEHYKTGEATLPADQAPVDAPLRPHRKHPWIKLVKVEIEKEDGTRAPLPAWKDGERIVLDFESSADFSTHPVMSHARVLVLLKNDKGQLRGMSFNSMGQLTNKGTWLLADRPHEDRFGFPHPPRMHFGGWGEDEAPPFTPNMEIFAILEDSFAGGVQKRYKISNSLVVGSLPRTTTARDWRTDEVEKTDQSVKTKLGLSPAEQEKKSAEDSAAWHAKVRAEQESFGGSAPGNALRSATLGEGGKNKFEYAKAATPVLGIAYTKGEFDSHDPFDPHSFGPGFDKHRGFEKIRPVLKDISIDGYERIMAKPGYAVGGINLEAAPYVSGFQVVFMRLEGNRLKPTDSYTSQWIRSEGEHVRDRAEYRSDGKLVIGVFGMQTTIATTLGLLFDPGSNDSPSGSRMPPAVAADDNPFKPKETPATAAEDNPFKAKESAAVAATPPDTSALDAHEKLFEKHIANLEKQGKLTPERARVMREQLKAMMERRKARQNRGNTAAATGPAPTSGDVMIEWGGRWWPGSILKTENGKSLVHYDNHGSNWDEWVGPDRIKKK